MSFQEKLLDKFAEGHKNHVQLIADMAGSDRLCCSGEDWDDECQEGEDEQEGLESAAREIMDGVPGFLTYTVPKHIAPSDSKWRSILTSIRSFYRWCVAEKFISKDNVMDKSLLALRKLPLNSLPLLISWLGRERYWDKLEKNEHEAVKAVGEKIPDWRRHDQMANFENPYRLMYDREQNYDRVLGGGARLEIKRSGMMDGCYST